MSGSEASSSIEPELVRSIKRSEYDQMVELGLFQDERVELLRGVLVKTSPQLAPHASTVQKLNELHTSPDGDRYAEVRTLRAGGDPAAGAARRRRDRGRRDPAEGVSRPARRMRDRAAGDGRAMADRRTW
jgi:hypothetical protein